jgi:hypothetical protein
VARQVREGVYEVMVKLASGNKKWLSCIPNDIGSL